VRGKRLASCSDESVVTRGKRLATNLSKDDIQAAMPAIMFTTSLRAEVLARMLAGMLLFLFLFLFLLLLLLARMLAGMLAELQ